MTYKLTLEETHILVHIMTYKLTLEETHILVHKTNSYYHQNTQSSNNLYNHNQLYTNNQLHNNSNLSNHQQSKQQPKCLKISYQFHIEEINLPSYLLSNNINSNYTNNTSNNISNNISNNNINNNISNNISNYQSHQQQQTFHAILGIKVIKNIPFFIIVKQHQSICAFQGSQIYQIKSISWIPILKHIQILQSDSDIEQELNNISKIFQQGLHYYSNQYHLYQPFLINKNDNQTKQNSQQQKYFQQFIWNSNIIKIDIQSQYMNTLFGENKVSGINYNTQKQIFTKWCTPIIQGYVNLFQTILPDNMKLQYLLISRRSYKKAGTRFFSRGIDDNGNVANYTQSQFIVQYRDIVLSNIQLRGSVPVFFQQIGVQGINIQLNIQRTKQLTKKPFITQFNSILQNYNRCLCINLLSQHKKSQQRLSNFFEQIITATQPVLADVRYQYFDFHEQCKNNQFHNTQKLITKLSDIIKIFGFNCYNLSSKKIIKKQSGVFRTNCLDCLDRTNYVQSRVALQTLKQMLKQFASVQVKRNIIDCQLLKHIEWELNSQLLNWFNLLWAQNGDSVSLHYTGIGSTHTDITKVGKRTLFGTVNHKMRSLMRFYKQFTDVKKHQTINTFLGNKSLLKFDYNHQQQKKTKQQNILVMSWQFTDPQKALKQFEKNPYNSKTYQFILNQLKQGLNNKHVMIVLFLYIPNQLVNWQSGINFDLKTFLNPFKNIYTEVINKWSDFITTQLQSGKNKYVLIDSNVYNSCKMLIFCKKNQIQAISNIKKDQVTSSLKTKQVALLTKLKFHQSPLAFQGFNVKNIGSFKDYVQKVNQKGFQQNILGRSKSTGVNQQSYRLIVGNIGSQSKLSQLEYRQLESKLIENNQLSALHKSSSRQPNSIYSQQIIKLIGKGCQNDELQNLLQSTQLMSQKKVKVLANYQQAPLQFIPSNNRILFWNEEGKIVRAKTYGKIIQSDEQNNQINSTSSQLMGHQKGISICYPHIKQQKHKQIQQCVYLELSYQIEYGVK